MTLRRVKRIRRSWCNKKLPCVDLSMILSITLANDLKLEYGIARKIDIVIKLLVKSYTEYKKVDMSLDIKHGIV